jgi:hypothetical protein
MKILLVGNGPVVLEHKLGSLIDSFPIVVRFNNFKLEGYQDYVGTKTDWFCLRACDDVKLIPAHSIQRVFSFVTYCKWTNGMKSVARQHKAYYGPKCTVIDELASYKIAQTIGLKNDLTEWPSIGALALGFFSTQPEIKEIVVHGFGGDPNQHYFSKPPRDACYHNWDKERKFLNSLKISRLAS